jgi:hypothetical protein
LDCRLISGNLLYSKLEYKFGVWEQIEIKIYAVNMILHDTFSLLLQLLQFIFNEIEHMSENCFVFIGRIKHFGILHNW